MQPSPMNNDALASFASLDSASLAEALALLTPQEQTELDRLLSAPRAAMPTVDPMRPTFVEWLKETRPHYTWDWRHLQMIQEKLQEVTDGTCRRLILTMPPRHGKSEMVTVGYTAYRMNYEQGLQTIVGAYNQDLSNNFSRKTRRLLANRVAFARDRNAVGEWELMAGGHYRSAGVGAGITGMGGHLIVVDDPIKSREEAYSAVTREAIWGWFKTDLWTRREPGAAVIIIMTRWHEDDLVGRILTELAEENWTVLNLPALAEDDDPMGRQEGEALCPERYDAKELTSIRAVLGEDFDALYQGHPSKREGNIIKTPWIRRWAVPPPESDVLLRLQSWDCAQKPGESNDFSCCTTWDVTRLGFFLRHEYHERVGYPELEDAAIGLMVQWQPNVVLIEDKASGISLIQSLKSVRVESLFTRAGYKGLGYSIIPVEPETDKVTRMAVESTAYQAGLVYHPEDLGEHPWRHAFEQELLKFPRAAHDDRVDTVSQLIRYARRFFHNLEVFRPSQQAEDETALELHPVTVQQWASFDTTGFR